MSIAAWLGVGSLFAQVPPESSGFKVVSEVNLVVLDVSVRDARGAVVAGLAKEDFKVFDNGREQAVTLFAREDLPATVGILVDSSGSMGRKWDQVVTAALSLVRHSHERDELFTVTCNDRVRFGLPNGVEFTSDAALLRASLLNQPRQGRTALYDGVASALQHLEKGTRQRKSLVVITDGADNVSAINARQALELAEQSRATVYAIGIFDELEPDRNPRFLRRVAELTGGRTLVEVAPAGLPAACETIAREIRSRYTVGYHLPEARGGRRHAVRVEVSAPGHAGLRARTRRSYLAP